MAVTWVSSDPATKDVHLTGRRTYLIDSENDLSNIPEDAPAGSRAYIPDLTKIWIKSNVGSWTKVGG